METITANNHVLEIMNEENAPNPRTDMDNLGIMACRILPDEGDFKFDESATVKEMVKDLKENYGAVVIVPLYINSGNDGITYSTGPLDINDNDIDGFIYAIRTDILDNFTGYDKNNNRLPMKKRITKKMLETTEQILKGEIDTYNKWVSGEVYYFNLYKIHTCATCKRDEKEHIDSCGGFYEIEDIADHISNDLPELKARVRAMQFD